MAIQREPFRPVASPVDRVGQARMWIEAPKPARDPNPAYDAAAGQDLIQLSKSLTQFSASLGSFGDRYFKQQAEEDYKQGQIDALTSFEAFGDAVSKGTIPANSSPWYMKGYRESKGRVMANTAMADIEREYATWEGKDSDDPNAFGAFIRDRVGGAIKGVSDRDVLSGMAPALQQFTARKMAEHADYTSKRIQQTHIDQSAAELSQIIDGMAREGTGEIDPTAFAGQLHTMERRLKKLGVPGAAINKFVIDTVTNKAEVLGQPGILTAIELNRPDGTPGAGTTVEGQNKVAASAQRIWSMQHTFETREQTREAKALATAKRDVLRDGYGLLYQGQPLPQELLNRANAIDPDTLKSLKDLEAKLQKSEENIVEDPKFVGELQQRVFLGQSSVQEVAQAVVAGRIKHSTGQKLHERVTRGVDPIFDHPTAKRAISQFSELTSSGFMEEPGARSTAQSIMTRAIAEWRLKNPDASADGLDFIDFTSKVQERIFKLYNDGGGAEALKGEMGAMQKATPGNSRSVPAQPGAMPQPAAVAPKAPNETPLKTALKVAESSGDATQVNTKGFAGLYQFGAPRLIDLGVYKPGAAENLATWNTDDAGAPGKWSGNFAIPGFPQVRTVQDFLSNAPAQEAVMQLQTQLADRDIVRHNLDRFVGQVVGGVPVTRDGLLAGIHFGGAGSVKAFLESNGTQNATDAYKRKTIRDYLALGAAAAAQPQQPQAQPQQAQQAQPSAPAQDPATQPVAAPQQANRFSAHASGDILKDSMRSTDPADYGLGGHVPQTLLEWLNVKVGKIDFSKALNWDSTQITAENSKLVRWRMGLERSLALSDYTRAKTPMEKVRLLQKVQEIDDTLARSIPEATHPKQ